MDPKALAAMIRPCAAIAWRVEIHFFLPGIWRSASRVTGAAVPAASGVVCGMKRAPLKSSERSHVERRLASAERQTSPLFVPLGRRAARTPAAMAERHLADHTRDRAPESNPVLLLIAVRPTPLSPVRECRRVPEMDQPDHSKGSSLTECWAKGAAISRAIDAIVTSAQATAERRRPLPQMIEPPSPYRDRPGSLLAPRSLPGAGRREPERSETPPNNIRRWRNLDGVKASIGPPTRSHPAAGGWRGNVAACSGPATPKRLAATGQSATTAPRENQRRFLSPVRPHRRAVSALAGSSFS